MASQREDVSVLIKTTERQKSTLRRLSLVTSLNSLILVVAACGLCWWLIHELVGKLPNIVKRDEWSPSPFIDKHDLEGPIDQVILTTTGTAECKTQLECIYLLNLLDLNAMNGNTYNFMLGGDGSVYEGYGWDNRASYADVFGGKNIAVAFIGSFHENAPPQKQIDALKSLLSEGVHSGKLIENYRIYPESMFDSTADQPDENTMNLIRDWSQYKGYM